MFTINDLLTMDLIPWYKNLTNSEIPGDRPIEFVSVNDLPLDDFIRKNEVVISIATPYVKNDELMTEFIEGLISANASLFLLAIPEDHMMLSNKNREIAEKNDLPILLIPWSLRFSDVSEAIFSKLHSDHNEFVEIMKTLQTDILNCFLGGGGLDTAAKIISSDIHGKVSIIDSNGHIVAGISNIPTQIQIPLEISGHLYGHLCMDTVKTQQKLELLSHTLSPLLSLWFYKTELIETTQTMAKDELIWGLANGSDPFSESNQRTATLMDLHLSRTYACIVGRIHFNGSTMEQWQKNWIDSNINLIRDNIISSAGSMGKEAMVTHQKNAIIAYIEIIPSSGRAQISKFLDVIEKKLKNSYSNLSFSWGISEIKDGPTDYKNYYLHAKLAAELSNNDTRIANRFFYENTIIYNMMASLAADENFVQITYDIIKPIINYDKHRNTKLMDTLQIYLACKNISEAARRLDRHRQTLLYQLEKIEDLTGLSLKNNDDLFLLEVCMRLQMT